MAQFAFASSAEAARGSNSVFFGGGLLFQNLGRVSGTDSGQQRLIGPVMPALSASLRSGFTDRLAWIPQLLYVPFGKKVYDGAASISVLTLSSPLAFALKGWAPIDFKFGPGLYFYMISGSGGTTTLNNGNSTATFALPARTELITMAHLTAGTGIRLGETFRLDTDVFVTAPFSAARRAVTGVMSVSFGVSQ